MDTNAMDANPFIAGSALAVEDVLAQQDPALSPSTGKSNPSPRTVLGPRWSGKRR